MLKRSEQVSEYELPVKINAQKDGGYVVTCPKWADCFAQGDTIEEAILEITAVAQSLIELYKEEELSIPLKPQKNKRVSNSLILPVIVAA
ncbi:MAG: type II toxin-antitoxin system HicB family antitoxin [Candidatus Curtissbacteria bacterium]|nr:type II toxin-antitoxin system HicB family antitoxin [Candidatus Curtissbacteria bacterium]